MREKLTLLAIMIMITRLGVTSENLKNQYEIVPPPIKTYFSPKAFPRLEVLINLKLDFLE